RRLLLHAVKRALAGLLLLTACSPKKAPPPSERPSVDQGLPGVPAPMDARERKLLDAMSEPDLLERAKKLSAIAADAPPSDRVGRLARVALVKAWAEAGDLDRMESAAGEVEIEDDAEGADLLNRMALASAAAGLDLDRGVQRARRALEIVEAMHRPPHLDPELWKRQTATTIASYRDTLGWVLVRNGNAEEGLKELDEAARRTPEDVAIAYHRGEALEALDKMTAAMD